MKKHGFNVNTKGHRHCLHSAELIQAEDSWTKRYVSKSEQEKRCLRGSALASSKIDGPQVVMQLLNLNWFFELKVGSHNSYSKQGIYVGDISVHSRLDPRGCPTRSQKGGG